MSSLYANDTNHRLACREIVAIGSGTFSTPSGSLTYPFSFSLILPMPGIWQKSYPIYTLPVTRKESLIPFLCFRGCLPSFLKNLVQALPRSRKASWPQHLDTSYTNGISFLWAHHALCQSIAEPSLHVGFSPSLHTFFASS